MNWNKRLRQAHRWVSIVFTGVVAAIFGALGIGAKPAHWIYLLPLIPLALLVLTGLSMFWMQHAAGWRSFRGIGG